MGKFDSDIRREIRTVRLNHENLLSQPDHCIDRERGYGRQLDNLQEKLRSMKGGPLAEGFFGNAMRTIERGS